LLARVATIDQHTANPPERILAVPERLQRPLAVGHLGLGHRHRVRQPQRVHGNVALDARDLLARVMALEPRRVRVLHALRVHDQQRWRGVVPLSQAGRANLIFLKPAPARS
jgi:hypothetical protein